MQDSLNFNRILDNNRVKSHSLLLAKKNEIYVPYKYDLLIYIYPYPLRIMNGSQI